MFPSNEIHYKEADLVGCFLSLDSNYDCNPSRWAFLYSYLIKTGHNPIASSNTVDKLGREVVNGKT